MALKNYQYNTIMRIYDARQSAVRAKTDARLAEIEAAIPEYTVLQTKLIENSLEYARMSLYAADSKDGETALVSLRRQNELLSSQKEELLVRHGYPADYLMPEYFCPDCKDTGLIGNTRCHCFKQAVVDLLYTQSNLSSVIREENFETFSLHYYDDTAIDPKTEMTARQNMQRNLDVAHSFVENFDREFNNLLLYGAPGLGKTFLSHCIAKELLNSAHTVLYLTAYELFDILSKSFREEDKDFSASSEHILDCDLLIIDDLGTELATAFTMSRLSLCINERFLNRRSTIISTNLGVPDLKNQYGERNFSRIFSSYKPLLFFGDDIRLKKKVAP
ncbi:MAG: AAA family ATPase [Lachnospiraceae bacterium]|nr:AAA family ATPase [Lachnospiraceae bacterium]